MDNTDRLITTVSHRELSRLQAALENEITARRKAELEATRLQALLSYQKLRIDARDIVLRKSLSPVKMSPQEGFAPAEWVVTPCVVEEDWMDIGDDYQFSSTE